MNIYQPVISGSLTVTGSTTFFGNITVNSGSLTMTSGSLSGTASLASNALLLQGTGSVGFATTASLLEVSSSQQQISSSLLQVSSSQQQISASLLNVVANYATTGSNSFRADQSITGSLVVSSTITAQTLVVQTVTSSIVYSSGSNLFGNALGDRQTFTGSMFVTGAVNFKTNQNFVLNSSSTGWISSFVNDYNNTSYIGVDNDGMYIQPSSKGTKVVAGNGTTYLYVTSSGIGIGNTNPKATLHLGPSLNTMPSATSIAVAGDTSIRFTAGSDGNADYGSYIAGTQYAGVRALSLGYRQGSGDILTMTITQLSENTGSVGIGTTSPSSTFHVRGKFGAPLTTGTSLNGAARIGQTSGNGVLDIGFGDPYSWLQSRNTTDYSVNYNIALNPNGGNVAIGRTDPAKKLDIYDTNGNATAQLKLRNAGTTAAAYLGAFSGNLYLSAGGSYDSGWSTDGTNGIANIVMETTNGGSAIAFGTANSNTSPAERMRIDSTGRVTVNSPTTYVFTISNTTNTSGQGVFVTAMGSNNNNASSYHYIAATGGADKFYLFGNGTYQTVSDIRLKKNITTVTDTYLDKLKDLRVVNYNWKDQEDGHPLEFGLIAQEVEELIPAIVHEGREHADNIKYKGIQASVLPYILIKAIQELKAEIEELKNK